MTIADEALVAHPWVGGELELSPDMLLGTEVSEAAWPFKSCQTITSGRTGLRLIAQVIKAHASRKPLVLLPAYLCPSILQPFHEEGIAVGYYRIHGDLTIDLEHLEYLVEVLSPGAVLFINYFGFPVSQGEGDALRQIKDHCWLIEDCAQGSLIEQGDPIIGQMGHFVITSFRKYLPVPDGGLVINQTGMALPTMPPARGRFVWYRLLGKLLRYEFLRGNPDKPELEKAYLTLFSRAEGDLDREVPLQAMSQISERLLGLLDLPDAMARRRRNFSVLLDAFTDEPRLQSIGIPVVTGLPPGVSPLSFPIQVAEEKRDALRRELMAYQVFCPIHWHLPDEVHADEFPDARHISQQILSLPIDQRYDEQDMQSLLECLLQVWDIMT